MVMKDYPIRVEGSEVYAKLRVYLWENSPEIVSERKPLILMCPGGGYVMTSDREADPIAFQFLAMGMSVAILRYSVAPAEYPVALLELATAMKMIKEHSEEWFVDEDKIFLQGCSAGGHLAASFGMFWHENWIGERVGIAPEKLKPAGMILCYPVITSGEKAHRGSFEALLKSQYTEEMLERTSLEKQVTEHTPPAFIWHTYTDDTVPVENSLMLIQAMKEYDISVEFHMYPIGGHGLSTSDDIAIDTRNFGYQKECQSWIPLVKTWLAGKTGINAN